MVRTEAARRQAARPVGPCGGSSNAAWGVTDLMGKDILPDDPEERRMRGRLRALRAVDRLGLLGEENLMATLARKQRLRWLVDEGGARWAVLAELGRIGEPGTFEQAVEWALEKRPRLEEVRAYVCRLKDGAVRPAGKERVDSGPIEEPAAIGPRLRVATAEEVERRC